MKITLFTSFLALITCLSGITNASLIAVAEGQIDQSRFITDFEPDNTPIRIIDYTVGGTLRSIDSIFTAITPGRYTLESKDAFMIGDFEYRSSTVNSEIQPTSNIERACFTEVNFLLEFTVEDLKQITFDYAWQGKLQLNNDFSYGSLLGSISTSIALSDSEKNTLESQFRIFGKEAISYSNITYAESGNLHLVYTFPEAYTGTLNLIGNQRAGTQWAPHGVPEPNALSFITTGFMGLLCTMFIRSKSVSLLSKA